jgi:hypothetical protein
MLNKNDPLIGAVQEVMKKNQAERDAVKLVNEKFGIQDRKVLPHERQHEWETAYKSVLTEGVEALDEKVNMTKKQFANLDGKPGFTGADLAHARAKTHEKKASAGTLEEDQIDEKAPPGREDQVKTLKKKVGKESAFKIAWSSYKKKKKIDEGFNDRHDSSVTASADKQVVADLNEKVGNPLLLNKAKTGTKPKARIGDTGIRRTISGTNDVQTRLANMRKKPSALSPDRNAELDKPGLEKAGVSQALKDPKAREVLAQTTKDAADFAVPSALTGGPVGSMITRGVVGGVTKGYGLVKNALTAGKTTATAAKPVVSAAAREGGSAVPKITKGTGQGNRIAAQRKPADGPWGSTKPPEVKPSTGLAPSGTFAANLQRARQTAQSGRVGGSTVGATQQAARLASRSKLAQTSQSGRVGGSTVGATQQAARLAARQRLSATAKDIRAGAGKVASAVRNNPKLAAGAAAGAAMTGFAVSKAGNQPPPVQAKPPKDQSRVPPSTAPTAPVAMTARKIEATPRKVSDTEIMNAPQYKQAVKAVGGEAGARKIQVGTDVSGVGKVDKGQTIWSKVKSQLEKQPVKGFEAGANKGGAGR